MKLLLPAEDKLIVTSEDDVAEGRYYSKNLLLRKLYRNRLQYAVNLITNCKTNSKNLPRGGSGKFKRILEIGCGSGVLTPTLQQLGEEVVSVDVHDKLALVNKNIPGNYLQANIFKLPFTEKFDCIVCLSVVEHLENFENALIEVKRHLADDGIVVWGIPSDNFLLTGWLWLNKSPAFYNHINSKREILDAVGRHYKILEKKTLRLLVPDYYTVVRCVLP